jgi:DNA-binding NtrC family response regulator
VQHALDLIGLEARWAGSHKHALSAGSQPSRIVLLDLGAADALSTARQLRAQQRPLAIIGAAARGVDVTADALQAGVIEIVRKPLDQSTVISAIERVHAFRATTNLCARLAPTPDCIFVRSTAMRQAVESAVHVGPARGIVMLGEPGTGRKLLARMIHRFDGQGSENFVVVDCVASRACLETELFGPGLEIVGAQRPEVPLATSSALGRALGGTLFIKNIGEMPSHVRARLARVLEDRRAYTGQGRYIELDLRLVFCAEPTVRNLAWTELVGALPFEQIAIPPLRERQADIPLLANYFLARMSALEQTPRKTLTPAATMLLAGLRWRGNAAELKVVLRRLALQVPGEVIRLEDVTEIMRLDGTPTAATGSLRDARTRFEHDYIRRVLEQHDGRVRDAARVLGIRRTNLYRKLRQIRLRASQELDPFVGRNDPRQASNVLTAKARNGQRPAVAQSK